MGTQYVKKINISINLLEIEYRRSAQTGQLNTLFQGFVDSVNRVVALQYMLIGCWLIHSFLQLEIIIIIITERKFSLSNLLKVARKNTILALKNNA